MDYLTTPGMPLPDAAKALGLNANTIRAWIKKGRMPPSCYIRLGPRNFRILVEPFNAWLAQTHESRGLLSPAPSVPPVVEPGPRHEGPVAGQEKA